MTPFFGLMYSLSVVQGRQGGESNWPVSGCVDYIAVSVWESHPISLARLYIKKGKKRVLNNMILKNPTLFVNLLPLAYYHFPRLIGFLY